MIKNFNKLGMLSLVGLLLCTQNNFVYATDDQVMKESKSIQEVEKSAKKEEIEKSNLLDLSVSMDSEKGKINFGSGTNALLNANKTYILDISANFTNDTSTTKSIEIKIPEGFEVIKYPNEKNINEYPNLLPFFNNSSVVKGNDIYPSVKAEEGVFTINLKPTVTAVDIPINVSLDTRFYRTTLQEDISVSVSEGVQRKTLNGNIQCNDTMKDRNHPEYDMKKNASLDEWNLPEIYALYVTRMNDQGNSINPQANFLCDEVIKEFIAPTRTEFKTNDSNEKVTTHDLGNGTTKFIVKSGTSSNIGSSFFGTSGYWKFPSSVFNIGDNPEVTYTRATYKLHGHPVKEVLSGSKIIYSIMENYEDVQVRNIGYGVDWVRKSIPNNEYLIFTYDISNKGINDSVNKEIVLNFEQTDLSAITGFYIPKGSLTEAGDEYVVKEISFKTTKSNTWKTVEGSFEKRINREDLGIIDDDEYFTEVKFNIGEIPKGVRLDGDPDDSKRCGVYGKIFKNPTDHPDLFKDKYTNIKPKASIEVKSVEGNKSTGKIEMNASLLNTKFDVYLSMYKSISKVAGDTLRLEYANSEFSKAVTNRPNIYLRSEGKLDFINFKIINDGKDITNQCLITLDHKETNGTFVYKISMKNVIGEDGIVGEYKGKFKKLNVSFDVHSSKDFSGGTWDLHDLIFLEDTENFNKWDNSFNSDPFDVNNNKKIDDQNIKFFKYASNEKTYSIIPRKTFFSDTSAKSKSETDEAYRNFNNEVTTNIVKVQDTAQMKVDLYNKGAQVAKEAIIYLPVPKIGINYGPLFQEEDFKWSMKLDTLLSSNDDYEISYANIVNIPSGGITTDQLKNYDYIEKEHWVKDLSDINMIRIKTKKEVQANNLTSFVFEFSQDGKKSKQLNKETAMNIFNVYQYFDLTGMAEGSSGYKKGDKLAFQSDIPNEYSVNFETNGGTKIDATKTIDGEKIKEPTNPSKEGFTFMGWYKDQALTKEWDFAVDVVNGDTTLYAKWDAVDKPVKPIEPVKPPEPDKPTKTETPEIEVIEKPNTGITTKMSMYLAFGLLSGCSLVAFAIIKRNKKTNR
ncbi:MAG: InlB B-repeat-containing protein [Bacilli bacterium]